MSKLELGESAYMTLSDVVFKSIRDAIISGDLLPGERLMEKDLAGELSVSRTPVREALRKLEIEGFVETIPRKGALVKKITPGEIADVLEIRAVLEAFAARKACSLMNDSLKEELLTKKTQFESAASGNDIGLMAQKDVELHDIIYHAAGNDRLLQIVNNLRGQIYRYRVIYLYDKKYLDSIVDEHGRLIKALLDADIAAAEKISAEHIHNQQKAIISSLKKDSQIER